MEPRLRPDDTRDHPRLRGFALTVRAVDLGRPTRGLNDTRLELDGIGRRPTVHSHASTDTWHNPADRSHRLTVRGRRPGAIANQPVCTSVRADGHLPAPMVSDVCHSSTTRAGCH
jgi:hypothetical protein